MTPESFRWLAGLIAAHPDRKVVGRTRLQKTVRLLQRKGFPTDYSFMLHFYGPYSDGLNAELRLNTQLGLVEEKAKEGAENSYYVYTAVPEAALLEIDGYRPLIETIRKSKDIPLELAATYDAFRELGYNHDEALQRTRQKKGPKCDNGNLEAALALLKQLDLPVG